MSGVLLFLLLVAAGVAVVVWQRRTHALDDQLDLLRDVLGRIYPSRPLSPRTLPRRLLRAASQTVTVGVSGSILLPTRIEISVNPADLEPLEGAIDWLSRDVAEALRQRAATEGWIVPDGPQIVIEPDPERPLRSPRARGRIGALRPVDVATLQRLAPVPAPSVDDEPTRTQGLPLPPTEVTAAVPAGPPTQDDVAGVYLRLVAVEGDGDGDLSALVLAGNEPLVLGRSREAPLQVDDRQASGRHCGFTLDPVDRELQIEDLGSTNGTFVDGRRVEHSALPPGTTLRVGASTWRVELEPV
ncbi:MAG TPA: FhaA domain-containing protein [Acidimicrobiales bacterium]|nr:FhaA domain-containing protein [Acidimicrobiales bacterium]